VIPLTLTWIAGPFLGAFIIYALPRLGRPLALAGAAMSALYAGHRFIADSPLTLRLLDHFGVGLLIDPLSAFFILTNAAVTAAVILCCWGDGQPPFFHAQVMVLHGSVNAAFVCADFISLYVALEVLSIAAFLLIALPRSDRAIWVGLRYLFVSNVAMLFYLVGAVLVYWAHHAFDFEGLRAAPPEAVALIFLGLMVKGGVFLSGLWLPLTHAEAASPVSALLSGIVVKAAVLALLRCALMVAEFDAIVRIFGVAAALLGSVYAVFEKDTKRLLAFSTLSQLGFILAAPEVGGFYALSHGLVKSALFLIAGTLPGRNLEALRRRPLHPPLWIALAAASFSISGFPLLSGFGAKVLTMKNLLPWQVAAMNLAALGTAAAYAKFIFLPHRRCRPERKPHLTPGFWAAMALLIGGLFAANAVYYRAYTLENIVKPLATIAAGWLVHALILRRISLRLPRAPERFEHLIGVMSLSLILLYWMAWA
jgi:multicomponent Na+:H+ antiporter subunit D